MLMRALFILIVVTIPVGIVFIGEAAAGIAVLFDDADFAVNANVVANDAVEVTVKNHPLVSRSGPHSVFNAPSLDCYPGGMFETLAFGATGSTVFEEAASIDWRNPMPTSARALFPQDFADRGKNSQPRATSVDEFNASLAGTSARKLGHNLGLRHQDTYGATAFTGSSRNTSGIQNLHVIATESASLDTLQQNYEQPALNQPLVQLSYADQLDLPANALATVVEIGDLGVGLATAMTLEFADSTLPDRPVVHLVASGNSDQAMDLFEAPLDAGATLSTDIDDESFGSNTLLRIFDSTNARITTNQDAGTDIDLFAISNVESTNSRQLNPATTADGITIDDNLLASVNSESLPGFEVVAVAEPAVTGLLAFAGWGGMLHHLRKRRRLTNPVEDSLVAESVS